MLINKTKSVYNQIAEDVVMKIISKEINNNDMLAPVREQAKQYNVTPKTIQNAMRELEELGLIKKVQGSGIYITVDEKKRKEIISDETSKLNKQYLRDMKRLGFSCTEAKLKLMEDCDD